KAAPERRRRPRLEPAACVRRVWAPGPLCGDAPFRRPPARLRRFGGRAHLPQRRSRANVDKAPVWLQRRVLRVRRRRVRRPEPRLRDLRQPGRDRHADKEALHDFGRRKSLAAAQSHRQARRTGLPWSGYADALAFPSASIGYLSADRAGVYRTSDGGRDWQTVLFTDDSYTVRDASWLDANTG